MNTESICIRDDGYINATTLCKTGNKKFSDWFRLEKTKYFLNELSIQLKIPIQHLVMLGTGGSSRTKIHTFVHPQVATNLAQWISVKFSISVSIWIDEWKHIKLDNQIKYNTEISNIEPYIEKEHRIRNHMCLLNSDSKFEVETPAGYIDIETDNEIIEIKTGSMWKHAMGQILSYHEYIPKTMRIHLFDIPNNLDLNMVKNILHNHNITLTIE